MNERDRWDEEKFSKELDKAVDDYDRPQTAALCKKLVEYLGSRRSKEPYSARGAKHHLSALRRKRYFDLMLRVADALIRSGQTAPQIRRQYAQAMLDRGMVSAALTVLREIQAEEDVSAREMSEARGLMGRAYKQIYVDSGSSASPSSRERLQSAIDIYVAVYESHPSEYTWHGINAASLLWRAANDGVQLKEELNAAEIARRVLESIEDKINARIASMWDLATAAEASLVKGDYKAAAEYLDQYVNCREADAFELASTLRQFEEVLLLERTVPEEAVLLDLLRGELLKKGGASLDTSSSLVHQYSGQAKERIDGLEALLGGRYQHHSWLLTAMQRARGVARIRRGIRGRGSGFLVPGGLLAQKWKEHQVLVTNNHVISQNPTLPQTLTPDEATITFDALSEWDEGRPDFERLPKYKVKDVLWESPARDLDVTCCRLDKKVDGVDEYKLATSLPRVEREDRVYVIGHPKGEELSYSLSNNYLLALNQTRIHYRSPTEPGSSGSPLFNDEWELIGIHHAGGEEMSRLDDPSEVYPANEGIPMAEIKFAIGRATVV